MTLPELLEPWCDARTVGDRSNSLMRENWLTLNEAIHMSGDTPDEEWFGDWLDLLDRCLDIESKYATTRRAEFAETQRRWYVHAFGPDYQEEFEWARTSSFPSRRTR